MLSKMVIKRVLKGNKKVPAGLYVMNIPLIIIKSKKLYTSNPRSPWTSPDYVVGREAIVLKEILIQSASHAVCDMPGNSLTIVWV